MRRLLLSCLLIGTGLLTQAQTGKIKTTVFNDQRLPAENATVELLKSADSSIVKTAITDKTGLAEFESRRFGTYLLRVTMVNVAPSFSIVFTLSAEQNDITVGERDNSCSQNDPYRKTQYAA